MSEHQFPTRQVGDFTVTAISDGYLAASLDLLSNIDAAEADRMQRSAGEQTPAAIHINCYVLQGAGRTILIDSGAGGIRQWGGHLRANLALAGIAPQTIDTVLLTHAHPDHVGGLMTPLGEVAFPNAELVVDQRELRFWQDDANLARASERARGNFQIARAAFDGYREKLRPFRPFSQGEVLPGIRAVSLPGHTEGHTGYLVESNESAASGNAGLLVWGDIVHFPHIQIQRPDVSIAFDQDSSVAADTRARLLDRVSADRLLIAGMHLGELGFASIRQTNGGYGIEYCVEEGSE
ncbi:MBL fold metallo-hydrolase [Pandoraea captiosa]|uniref:MBL fold metallo-hydrolase n=1 Tax=Pandoraea captiosa TaxID=2508302 RepID=A0A5E4ZLJ3_9BURK|nr:MBL fold metallo-hydrolase [Pandoraea captiosa]VVE61718.1 MBL fold metallo-hydrolase [Pandoraea captiosa]